MASSLENAASPSRDSSVSLKTPSAQQREDVWTEELFDELDGTQSGHISRQSIENSLIKTYHSLAPTPKPYHLIHSSRLEDWTIFVDTLFQGEKRHNTEYTLDEFKVLVQSWSLPPFPDLPPEKNEGNKVARPMKAQGKLSHFFQRVRTRLSTNTHRYIFVVVVLCLQISLALWQFFTLFNDRSARAAFGTGVLIAKAASGALYPTLTLMIFSMSRWTQHFLRQSKYLRQFVDWEFAQSFHMKMACLAFLLGTIHAVAHLTGTYRHGVGHPQALAYFLSTKSGTSPPSTYLGFMKWRASWTGLISLGIFTIMSISSSPMIRKRSFELFQWTHLLMYPLYAMLLVHGSSAILKAPILGWWLLLPILLVLTEKMYRFYRGFIRLEATVLLAEDNMIALSIKVRNKLSNFRPGQYIYLQIPAISRVQWHPFTVSKITEDSIVIHIRTTAGDWTSSLWDIGTKTTRLAAAMEGPYGSPSREFYRYDNTIIFGAGIGITPFSAILFDLFDKLSVNKSPWQKDSKSVKQNIQRQNLQQGAKKDASTLEEGGSEDANASALQARQTSQLKLILQKRSISLHWTVKSSQDLQWMSSLLNKLSSELSVRVNIHLYVTQSHKDESASAFIFRSLLDHHRVHSIQSTSILTGLVQTCHFSRPDLENILDNYHRTFCSMDIKDRPRKVGVIYCGPVTLGNVLSRRCQHLTGLARAESARLRYYYHSESF